jgi:hypothetical protein
MFPATPTAATWHRLQPEFYGYGRLAPKTALDDLQTKIDQIRTGRTTARRLRVVDRTDSAVLNIFCSWAHRPWRVANGSGMPDL